MFDKTFYEAETALQPISVGGEFVARSLISHKCSVYHISGQDAFQRRDLIPRTPAKTESGKGRLLHCECVDIIF